MKTFLLFAVSAPGSFVNPALSFVPPTPPTNDFHPPTEIVRTGCCPGFLSPD